MSSTPTPPPAPPDTPVGVDAVRARAVRELEQRFQRARGAGNLTQKV